MIKRTEKFSRSPRSGLINIACQEIGETKDLTTRGPEPLLNLRLRSVFGPRIGRRLQPCYQHGLRLPARANRAGKQWARDSISVAPLLIDPGTPYGA